MLLSIVLLLWLQPTFSMNEEISYTLSLADVEEYLISNPKDFQDFVDSLNTSLNSTESVQSNPTTTPSLIPNTYKQPEKIYTIKNTFTCDKCSNIFISENVYLLHYQREHGPKIYACDFCGESYAVNGDLQQHLRRKHKDKIPRKYTLHTDDRSKHPPQLSKNISCSFYGCNQIFSTFGEFREHYSEHQTESLPQECPECKKIYHTKSSYNYHRKIKHGILLTKKTKVERKKIHFVHYQPS